jgi:hypothetical protein
MPHIDIVFDGTIPNARFIEIEDENGKSIEFGEWIDRGNGTWALRITDLAPKHTHPERQP